MEEGGHSRGFGGGHQPNGMVPRPMAPQPIAENGNVGMGNGSAGGAPLAAPREIQQDLVARGDRGQRDQVSVPSKESSRSRDRAVTKDNKAIPKMLKIAVVGDSTAGKTAICNAVTSEGYNFNKNYHLTCGVGIHPKSIKLPEPIEGQDDRVNMILVDSSGKDIYTEYLPKYWDKLTGVVVVIDLTAKSSLQQAGQWLQLAKGSMPHLRQGPDSSGDHHGHHKNASFLGVLIGNKIDLAERRAISPKAAQDFATKNSLQYFECSVKDNSGLEEPFFYLAHQWVMGFLGGPALSRNQSMDKENIEDDQF